MRDEKEKKNRRKARGKRSGMRIVRKGSGERAASGRRKRAWDQDDEDIWHSCDGDFFGQYGKRETGVRAPGVLALSGE